LIGREQPVEVATVNQGNTFLLAIMADGVIVMMGFAFQRVNS
jgi:hypothetical protein